MKSIQTLIPDIKALVTSRTDWLTPDLGAEFGMSVAKRLQEHYGPRPAKGSLRLSRMGPRCPCALWYEVHHPELAEDLPAEAMEKYSFGHIIEAKMILLAKAAGHTVTGEQDELVVDGIVGHRDCVIDGHVVDVKSTSSQAFGKFKDGSLAEDDSFGYLEQLDGYMAGSADDPLVAHKSVGYILAVDKQLGKMTLYEHHLRLEHIRERINQAKAIAALPSAPKCECPTVAGTAEGNIRLGVQGSYNAYKFCCNPHLRIFIYSGGPQYFTKVVKRPTYRGEPLIEVDRYGKIVYN